MISKNVVAASLMAFLFIVSNIFLFGLVDTRIFPILYFIFAGIFIGLIVFIFRISFEGVWQYAAVILSAFLLVGSMTFFASNLKEYNDDFKVIEEQKASLNNDIAQLKSSNDYYKEYADYLKTQVDTYQANNDNLESEIKKVQENIANTATIEMPEAVEAIYYYEDDDEEDDDEEDDDEEDDDD